MEKILFISPEAQRSNSLMHGIELKTLLTFSWCKLRGVVLKESDKIWKKVLDFSLFAWYPCIYISTFVYTVFCFVCFFHVIRFTSGWMHWPIIWQLLAIQKKIQRLGPRISRCWARTLSGWYCIGSCLKLKFLWDIQSTKNNWYLSNLEQDVSLLKVYVPAELEPFYTRVEWAKPLKEPLLRTQGNTCHHWDLNRWLFILEWNALTTLPLMSHSEK